MSEVHKIRWELVPYTRGLGLDIGCGAEKAFPHFIGVDNRADSQEHGVAMDPDLTVPDATILPMFADGSMDFVFSSHLLHLLESPREALREWWRLVKLNGHLCLYLPHKDLVTVPGQKHAFMEQDVIKMMEDFGGAWDLCCCEKRSADEEQSFFLVFRKLSYTVERQYSYKAAKPKKTAAIVRYGAFGDLLQASSILAGLKAQGFHITLYTSPRGQDIVRYDLRIDHFIIQDKDQVPNVWLGEFWEHISKKYDRFVNLSESVEGTWLALPGRTNHSWPHHIRAARLDYNYIQFQHELADIPYEVPRIRFFSTDGEKRWAQRQLDELGGGFTLLWSLAGSSGHKTWPYLDTIISRVMLTLPDARVVFVGDELCQILETPWTKEPRVWCRSGVWSIRETLTFAQRCDLIIGPETGVLNAVAMDKMPKIVMLSHSSHNNLTRDWVNTYALFSTKTPCYPCHRMHYSFEYCKRGDATGVAQCMEDLPADAVWEAFLDATKQYRSKLEQQGKRDERLVIATA